MTALYISLYTICILITFVCAVKLEKKEGYVTTGILVLFTRMAVIWPLTLTSFLIILFYEQLEKWVNK